MIMNWSDLELYRSKVMARPNMVKKALLEFWRSWTQMSHSLSSKGTPVNGSSSCLYFSANAHSHAQLSIEARHPQCALQHSETNTIQLSEDDRPRGTRLLYMTADWSTCSSCEPSPIPPFNNATLYAFACTAPVQQQSFIVLQCSFFIFFCYY